MGIAEKNLVGTGLYTVKEAEALTGVPAAAIRRWLRGYEYHHHGGRTAMPPVWASDTPATESTFGLSFLDLMEVRFVHAFRKHHVSWNAIREAARRACEIYGSTHPFSMKRFKTDGKRIFAELERERDIQLLDINREQFVFHNVVERSLYVGIEFDDGQAARWFPLYPQKKVVIDPERAFGRPIVDKTGIPAEILAKAAEVEGSIATAARWYDVSVSSVKAAIEFQRRVAG